VAKGINDAGADVYDLGLSTTPMVYFGTAMHGFGASVQITASHNPKEYNGMKISCGNALPVGFDNGLSTIRQWIEEGRETPVAETRGRIIPFDISQQYISFLKSRKEDILDLKISIDISNGMAAQIRKLMIMIVWPSLCILIYGLIWIQRYAIPSNNTNKLEVEHNCRDNE
jgi:phosphomannomutase